MVNSVIPSKFSILKILRSASEKSISGQILADELGVSRVAVWKAVQSLQESGYGISSQGKGPASGYTLIRDLPDSLFPWEFGELHTKFKHYVTTASTMDEARIQAVQNSKVSIITADEQTKGRGRLDHAWVTQKDSLSFTLITRPESVLGFYNRQCALSQIALVRVFEKISGRKFYVRWPNDIWSNEGKVAGILSDVQGTGDSLSWVNLGIGINISSKPSVAKSDAVFLGNTHKILSRKEILLEFLKEYESFENETKRESNLLSSLWNARCPDIGKNMRVKGKIEPLVFNGINNWAWAQCEDALFPPGDMRFEK